MTRLALLLMFLLVACQKKGESGSSLSPVQFMAACRAGITASGENGETASIVMGPLASSSYEAIFDTATERFTCKDGLNGGALTVMKFSQSNAEVIDSTGAVAEKQANERLPKDDFAVKCQLSIRDQLKAPSTAKFAGPWDIYISGSALDGYVYRGYVDAENSFGASLRNKFICTSEPGSENVTARLLE